MSDKRFCQCECHNGAKFIEVMPCCDQIGEPASDLKELPEIKIPDFTKYVFPMIRRRKQNWFN